MRGAWRLAWPPLTASLALTSVVIASVTKVANNGTTNSTADAAEGEEVESQGNWDLKTILGSGGLIGAIVGGIGALVAVITGIIALVTAKGKLAACLCNKEESPQDLRIANINEIGFRHHNNEGI